jgi:hypothetical protein
MGRRYALRDDQWDVIKDLLPGRAETAAQLPGTTSFLSRQCCTDIALALPTGICQSGSAIGKTCIGGIFPFGQRC